LGEDATGCGLGDIDVGVCPDVIAVGVDIVVIGDVVEVDWQDVSTNRIIPNGLIQKSFILIMISSLIQPDLILDN
jgi:hypothetical protein